MKGSTGTAADNMPKSPPLSISDIQTNPIRVELNDSYQALTIKVDAVDYRKEKITVSGWCSDGRVAVRLVTADQIIPSSTKSISRPDVSALIAEFDGIEVSGFEIVGALTEKTAQAQVFLTLTLNESLIIAPLSFARETSKTRDLNQLKLTSSTNSKAHIDFSGAILGKLGIISGWAISKPGATLWLQDSQGNKKAISSTLRFHRNDIGKVFGEEYSIHTVYAGFVTDWPFPQVPGESLAIVEETLDAFKMVATAKWTAIADDPVSYAKFSFSVPTPTQDFNYRLNQWEGAAINSLIEAKNSRSAENETPATVWTFGKFQNRSYKYSIIIPLYGRWDFVEHQLSEFTKDNIFLSEVELIYVIDDPVLITPFINEAENLFNLYGVPFKIIWGNRNRGFSGANNLGVSHSKGDLLILLNSDVFPSQPGWVQEICAPLLSNPDFGIIGAKLLFPDGGLQHGGMTFLFSESWSVWLNKHPWAGLDPHFDQGNGLVEKPAVTGACMAMRRADYLSVDGFDEGYLIGDFEDSDLCMKIRSSGLKIGYLPNVVLTHLERQSFSLLGDSSFRTMVVRYNAWRHSQRWSKSIKILMRNFKGLENE